MLFNSIDFALFFPIVFIIYWFLGRIGYRAQNIIIVLASYVFYGWWDYRFLFLIIYSTIIDFFVGQQIPKYKNKNIKKALLYVSIIGNLGLLFFLKYYNFFIDNFILAFSFFGKDISAGRIDILLPVGISFYTLQTLSYTIDIYKEKLTPTKDLIAFAAFVSFFPQLVAGPIERALSLLPQFYKQRLFDKTKAIDGLRQILWGLFKKVVIADQCAFYVDLSYADPDYYTASAKIISIFLFTIQIYCDFSGYTDIAIGLSRQFGVNLNRNFKFPYFSTNIIDFWRRWHISLSTWFRDYVYIPIGGSRGGMLVKIRNIYVIFVIIGLWHGADWKFVLYGILNASFYLLYLFGAKGAFKYDLSPTGIIPSWKQVRGMIITFSFLSFSRIFFRAKSLKHALEYFSNVFSKSIFSVPNLPERKALVVLFGLILFFFFVEWIGKNDEYAIAKIYVKSPKVVRYFFYYTLIFLIWMYFGREEAFIYFQF